MGLLVVTDAIIKTWYLVDLKVDEECVRQVLWGLCLTTEKVGGSLETLFAPALWLSVWIKSFTELKTVNTGAKDKTRRSRCQPSR